MADLFSMLGVTARALDAQRFGLDVIGQNLANVNTPGYARRSIVLGQVAPTDPWSAGGGVDVMAVQSARAPLIEARLRLEQPASARDGAVAEHLAVIEAGFGLPGASLDAEVARFYNTYGALALNPTSSVARQQVILEGQSLAAAFAEMASRLDASRRSADADLRDAAMQVTALARQLADLNRALSAATGTAVEGLRDQQSVVLAQLSELAAIQPIQREDGTIDITIGNGRALVVADLVYPLQLESQPPDGFAALLTDGAATTTDITAEITGGRISGLLAVRDTLVPGYIDRLDALAYGVVTDVNALTRSGYDLSGAAGVDFFAQPAVVAGASRLVAVRAAVAADSGLVVAASAPAAGSNGVARAVAALQDTAITGGTGRPSDAWSELVYRVGADVRTAQEMKVGHDQVTEQLRVLRDQISGVSIDEEAALLMRFQRAYEANARFFQVTDQTLDLLMQLVRA